MRPELKTHMEALLTRLPEDLLSRKGTVFFSEADTLFNGYGVYLLGANPGGEPDDQDFTIQKSLENFGEHDTHNAYISEYFKDPERKLQNTFQKNIQYIFDSLNLNLKNTCGSNIVFERSKSFKDISKKLIPVCFKAHKYIINTILKPSVIIAIGKNSYEILKNKWNDDVWDEIVFKSDTGEDLGPCAPAYVQSKDAKKVLLYIPHPSYGRWFCKYSGNPKIAEAMAGIIADVRSKRATNIPLEWNFS
ncbi:MULTISPECIES: hypothetical protein [unclassified Desulfovibrio]|uniref:hypothetical protein n=1 Tax=unclassified Desulfovibrio TaxID=2593640 RepID=UPI0013EB7693|nr:MULTISPECIES: hypothetical protein [unclassified Desulfovibrio]